MRQPVVPALIAVLIGATVSGVSARGQDATNTPTMSEVRLPGGARGALATINDPGPVDRSHLLLEVIRRAHETPMGLRGTRRDGVIKPLIAYLDGLTAPAAQLGPNAAAIHTALESSDTLPLPLSPPIWINVILGGRGTADTLVADILRSRGPALLYCGLLSLDDGTRAWIATQPELLAEMASRYASAFLIAAPALQLDGNRFRVPGGEPARAMWDALLGRQVREPASFVRALLSERDGRLAYFFAAMASLTPAQIGLALDLDSPDPSARIDAGRRLYGVFQRIAEGWNIDDRPFWRPSFDPALLVSDLATTADGRPILPGTRAFWNNVFADGGVERSMSSAADDLHGGEPVEFAWLADQVFHGRPMVLRRPYQVVLFASRLLKAVTPDNLHDAVTTVRAANAYPALTATLERARVSDVATYAKVVRRAAQLSDSGERGVRAVAQFSGALAFITRAASRGSLTDQKFSEALSSLGDVELSERGDYDGRLVRWLQKLIDASVHAIERSKSAAAAPIDESFNSIYENAIDPFDRDALRMLAGDSGIEPRVLEWEGTHYRLDFVRAEMTRLARLLGDQPRPYLSSAIRLLDIADALRASTRSKDRLRAQATALEHLGTALRCDARETWEFSNALNQCRDLVSALQRAARTGDGAAAERLAPRLRALADDLLARGLVEMAYAVALGQPEAAPISASDAASRHDFGLQTVGFGASGPWRFPVAGADRTHDWHVTGSLLDLDVKLATFSLLRLSSKPPPFRPSMHDEDRQALIESVPLAEPQRLTDAGLRTIVDALKNGRARLAAIHSAADADAVADDIPLTSARRTLLKWMLIHDPDRLPTFLSPTELLWLGGGNRKLGPELHVWGISGEPRLGCLCLQITSPQAVERLAGRWYSGIFATGFADLHLRLAELLTELAMPAPVLAPVLASASLEFITNARFRDADDRRSLIEFVHSLRVDNMEQYLGLLTTDGPLVPIVDGTGHAQTGLIRIVCSVALTGGL